MLGDPRPDTSRLWHARVRKFLQELDENVEYKEREDEFDIVVEPWDPEGLKRKEEERQEKEKDIYVSIDTIDTVGTYWPTDQVCGYLFTRQRDIAVELISRFSRSVRVFTRGRDAHM